MEKRFIPLHCRLLRFFCTGCERPFAMNNGEVVPRQKGSVVDRLAVLSNRTPDAPSLINCTHCGQEYNILLVQPDLYAAPVANNHPDMSQT